MNYPEVHAFLQRTQQSHTSMHMGFLGHSRNHRFGDVERSPHIQADLEKLTCIPKRVDILCVLLWAVIPNASAMILSRQREFIQMQFHAPHQHVVSFNIPARILIPATKPETLHSTWPSQTSTQLTFLSSDLVSCARVMRLSFSFNSCSCTNSSQVYKCGTKCSYNHRNNPVAWSIGSVLSISCFLPSTPIHRCDRYVPTLASQFLTHVQCNSVCCSPSCSAAFSFSSHLASLCPTHRALAASSKEDVLPSSTSSSTLFLALNYHFAVRTFNLNF